MDDVKDKFKGFMKKVSSSSSSGKFKGQGRVLGSSSSGPVSNPVPSRPVNPGPTRDQTQIRAESKPEPLGRREPPLGEGPAPSLPARDGFDPFDSMITSGKRSKNGFSLNVFECPICGEAYRTEDEVSLHVDNCVNGASNENLGGGNGGGEVDGDGSELEGCVGVYMSGNPKEGSVEVVLKLLGNVAKEPGNAKFRWVRMGNSKIREAVTDFAGGVELLEAVGFALKEEGGEMWAVMEDAPDEGKIGVIYEVARLLERKKVEKEVKAEDGKRSVAAAQIEETEEVEPQKIDRQIRVFFSVPESTAARIELPDSFYKLSLDEVKREADSRKKKLADSQLLIPKSYKEKQAKATRKRYLRTIIRIQFPDGVVLQGVFAPWEPTTTLYEGRDPQRWMMRVWCLLHSSSSDPLNPMRLSSLGYATNSWRLVSRSLNSESSSKSEFLDWHPSSLHPSMLQIYFCPVFLSLFHASLSLQLPRTATYWLCLTPSNGWDAYTMKTYLYCFS